MHPYRAGVLLPTPGGAPNIGCARCFGVRRWRVVIITAQKMQEKNSFTGGAEQNHFSIFILYDMMGVPCVKTSTTSSQNLDNLESAGFLLWDLGRRDRMP